ncbi:DUF6660 family protein [Pedobacter sp. Leaf250]|uniref:DUF6660 family protein n=1 Tax=Pedobacter sp. Leaf250 TaxID=2876559 RepID=UPI00351D8AFF
MKFLIYLMSFLIVSLSCINCEDVMAMVNNPTELSISNIEKSKGLTDQDNCSPLCTCNCCGQLLLANVPISIPKTLKRLIPEKELKYYSNHFLSKYTQNIWQPPKLNIHFIG